MENEKYCKVCERKLKEIHFYKKTNGECFDTCKSCCSKIPIGYKSEFLEGLKELDVPFVEDVFNSSSFVGEYIKKIYSLPQYNRLTFKDSIEIKDNIENLNPKYLLINELNCLGLKIQACREKNDIGTYKNLILAYKEVLNLLINMNVKPEELCYDMNKNTSKMLLVLENKSNVHTMSDLLSKLLSTNIEKHTKCSTKSIIKINNGNELIIISKDTIESDNLRGSRFDDWRNLTSDREVDEIIRIIFNK